MNGKVFGYLASFIGLVALLVSTPKGLAFFPFIEVIPLKFIVIGAIILIGVGVIIVMSYSPNKTKLGKEVPIYKGKEIVGYRVMK
ncbi:MAG: hypothetical protein Q8N99_02520 [Nanoarchaeota archaeon]|nr:hypothetical protein [Nanoarchaeota archaeon]